MGTGEELEKIDCSRVRSRSREPLPRYRSIAREESASPAAPSNTSDRSEFQETTGILWEDVSLRLLYVQALEDQYIGKEKFQCQFRRLLNGFVSSLLKESLDSNVLKVATYIRSNCSAISRDISSRATELKNFF